MIFLFASMVIRSPLRLKIRQISFFMFSVSLGVVLVVASPISRQVGLLAKFGLWSLRVMNASLLAVLSTLSSIPSFVKKKLRKNLD